MKNINYLIESTFNFDLIDSATTMHYLSKLTPSHSCGHDNLSAITLKCIANEICKCLTLIINQTITTLHSSLGRGEAIYRTFSFHRINIWNYLSKHIPINVSYACFKKTTKCYLMENDFLYRLVA